MNQSRFPNTHPQLKRLSRWKTPMLIARVVSSDAKALRQRRSEAIFGPDPGTREGRELAGLTRVFGPFKQIFRTAYAGIFGRLYAVDGCPGAVVYMKPLAKRGRVRTYGYGLSRVGAGIGAVKTLLIDPIANAYATGTPKDLAIVVWRILGGGAVTLYTTLMPTPFSAAGSRFLARTRRDLRKLDQRIWEVRMISTPLQTDVPRILESLHNAAVNHGAAITVEAAIPGDAAVLRSAGFEEISGPTEFVQIFAKGSDTPESGRAKKLEAPKPAWTPGVIPGAIQSSGDGLTL